MDEVYSGHTLVCQCHGVDMALLFDLPRLRARAPDYQPGTEKIQTQVFDARNTDLPSQLQ